MNAAVRITSAPSASEVLSDGARRAERLLEPESIAIVGATDNATGIRLLENIQSHKFAGRIYPVNPKYPEIAGLKCYPSVVDIPEPVDVVAIRVGAGAVAGVLRECVEAGVGAVVILVAGFEEDTRGEGKQRQAEIDEILAGSDLIVCGPNSEGYLNLTSGIPLTPNRTAFVDSLRRSASWLTADAEVLPAIKGGVAVLAQSGGLAFSVLSRGVAAGVGFSHIVSVGNETDIDVIDCASYLITRPEVRVIGMYVEGFRRPERLTALADQARAAGKAIVIGKAGDSAAGSAAALSHTGHLAGEALVNDAVFRRHGLIQVYDQEELLDVCAALAVNPPLLGGNVAVVSWSGGSAVWTSDALDRAGFTLPAIDEFTQSEIAKLLPPFASIQNPVDVTGASQVGLASVMRKVADAPDIDALLLITTLNSGFAMERDGDDLAELAREVKKPILVYSYTDPTPENRRTYRELGLVLYPSSERCVRALAALRRLGEFLARPHPEFVPVAPAADSAVVRHLATERQTSELLREAGFPVAHQLLATTAAEATSAAEAIGMPVALKLQAPTLAHKAAAGGVLLNVSADQVRDRYQSLVDGPGSRFGDVEGVLVQQMVTGGVEMLVGVDNTAGYGPIVVLGFGGGGVERIRDVAMECAPLSKRDAARMIDSLRRGAVLDGSVAGLPSYDIDALIDFVVKLSHWAVDNATSLLELDINPVVVHQSGVTVVDSFLVTRAGLNSAVAR